MWTFEHRETTAARPAEVWAQYTEPATWPRWDQDLRSARADGPLVVGTRGTLRPASGPPVAFTITEVAPGRAFTTVSRLPLGRLAIEHEVHENDRGTDFIHRVTITGPLSGLYARILGPGLMKGLPVAMQALAAQAVRERPATR